MFPVYFCCWVQFFPHTQTVEVDFPCESRAHYFVLGLLSPPCVFVLAVVSNFVLDHCVFVVSHFLLGSAFEFPWLCWERCLLTFVGCGLLSSLMVDWAAVVSLVSGVVAELFWPR